MNVLGWSAGTTAERIGCRLEFADDGRLLQARRTSGERVVTGFGVTGATVDGVRVGPRETSADIHPDEVEQRFALGDLAVRVRHNLDRTWQLRLLLTNPTERQVVVDRLGWEVTPGADARVVVHAAGAVGSVAFHTRPGSVLAFRLSRGEFRVDDEGLTCPRLVLEPGASWSLALHGEWYADRDAVAASVPEWFPETTIGVLDAGEFAVHHPDAAHTWHGDRNAGVRLVEVADARGTAAIEVAVAPAMADEVARLVRAAVDAGTVGDAAEAVVVALGATLQVDDRCADLLDEYADRTPDAPSALQVCLWSRLATLGRPGMFERALETAARLAPGPGTGLAAVLLWTTGIIEGRDPAGLRSRVERLGGGGDDPLDPATVVELAGLAGRSDDVVARAAWELELLCHADPGELWPRRSDEELARAVAVRTLAQDPCDALVSRLLARCADRVDPRDNAVVLAWLAFSGN
ncbi:hypothetical protein GCM10028815_08730 [Mariniluteicoccus flavus]